MEDNQKLSRASLLAKLAVAPLAIGALAVIRAEEADALTAKSAVQYVEHPVGGKQCSGCKFFKPGKTKTAAGACSIVAGSILPNAYCVAYAAK